MKTKKDSNASAENSASLAPSAKSDLVTDDRMFELLVDSVEDYAFFMLDAQGYVRSWNKGAHRIKGYTAEDIIGQHFSKFYTQEDLQRSHPEGELEIARSQGKYEEEGWRLRKDGSRFWANVLITAVKDDKGQLLGFSKVTRDLTARKLQEDDLRRKQELISDFIENGSLPMHWVGPNGKILWANKAELRAMGYAAEEYIGRHIADFHADREIIEEILQRLSNNEVLQDFEARLKAKDGSIRHVLIDSSVFWEEEKFVHTRCFTRDVTDRKRFEQALKESEEQFRTLANSIPQLGWIADPSGWIYWYNQPWYEYTGTSLEEMEGWGWEKVHHPDHKERVLNFVKDAWPKGESWELTFPLKSKSGEWRWFLTRAVPVKNSKGHVLRWFGTNTDVTDQLEAQNVLKEAVRLRDEFLSIASHELRTPLTPIKMHLQMGKLDLQRAKNGRPFDPEDFARVVDVSLRQIDHLAALIDSLLDVSRIEGKGLELKRAEVDLIELLRDLETQFQETLSRADTALAIKAHAKKVVGLWDSMRIEQVLINLLTNAIKYGAGKPIEIQTWMDTSYAWVEIKDQGMGIDPSLHEKIFDRFERAVSHKKISGLGLGLYIAKQIVQEHKGQILLESQPGCGATFTVKLPLREEVAISAS